MTGALITFGLVIACSAITTSIFLLGCWLFNKYVKIEMSKKMLVFVGFFIPTLFINGFIIITITRAIVATGIIK